MQKRRRTCHKCAFFLFNKLHSMFRIPHVLEDHLAANQSRVFKACPKTSNMCNRRGHKYHIVFFKSHKLPNGFCLPQNRIVSMKHAFWFSGSSGCVHEQAHIIGIDFLGSEIGKGPFAHFDQLTKSHHSFRGVWSYNHDLFKFR